jgi:hypothetical protein
VIGGAAAFSIRKLRTWPSLLHGTFIPVQSPNSKGTDRNETVDVAWNALFTYFNFIDRQHMNTSYCSFYFPTSISRMSTLQRGFAFEASWDTEGVSVSSASALPDAHTSHSTAGTLEQLISNPNVQVVSQSHSGLGGRHLYSKEQWEAQKPIIYRLYNQENKPYNRVVEILCTEHQFFPTYIFLFSYVQMKGPGCVSSL